MKTTKKNAISFNEPISREEIAQKTEKNGIMKYRLVIIEKDINRPNDRVFIVASNGSLGISIFTKIPSARDHFLGGHIWHSFDDFVNIVYRHLKDRQDKNLNL